MTRLVMVLENGKMVVKRVTEAEYLALRAAKGL